MGDQRVASAAPRVRLGVCPLALALLQAAAPQLLLGCQPAAVVLIPAGGQGQRQSTEVQWGLLRCS